MQFDSLPFFVFFVIVYGTYLVLQRGKMWRWQNVLILIASYVFYGWWDWRFLSLIALSTVCDYVFGRLMGVLHQEDLRRRWLLLGSLVVNLGVLGFFKYFGFFITSLVDALSMMGLSLDPFTLKIVLPVGISFYTFQTLSYTIDIYRGQMEPEHNFINFAAFVSFFPQLVAGPIERASNLVPQFAGPRTISAEQVNTALWLIVWGFFKKLVIANTLALTVVNPLFADFANLTYLQIFSATLAFAFQIYGDFSGYSDIARGLGKLMGFELMVNFRIPYVALNPSDFWNRWHISLSTWLRDYLYIPLGGNRKGEFNTYRNLLITMLLGGLWHGAAWNFVLWGAFHGVILIIYRLSEPANILNKLWEDRRYLQIGLRMMVMFGLTLMGWLLFRIESPDLQYLFTDHALGTLIGTNLRITLIVITPLLLVQAWQYVTNDLLAPLRLPWFGRAVLYAVLILAMMLFSPHETIEFIYFQF